MNITTMQPGVAGLAHICSTVRLLLETIKLTRMKRLTTMMALAATMLLTGPMNNQVSAQGIGVSITYQTFYDELSPHGRWIEYPEYGYVWAPNLGPDFQPYSTGGYWAWSDEYEWIWVSDYSWGWAPFHYGRWFHDPFYGWMWVPGYDWSPAWVTWSTGGDYYGWAPIRPGINISIGFGSYHPPANYWCFAPRRYIGSRHINRYYVDRSRNTTIINNITIINNYSHRNNVYVNGPRRHEAERYAGSIRPVRFRDADRPGQRQVRNNEVRFYRPNIQRDQNRTFAPRQFDRYDRDNANAGRRNVFDRPNGRNENISGREARPGRANDEQTRRLERPERRNVFDRGQNSNRQRDEITQPGNRQPSSPRNVERPQNRRNVFDRGQEQRRIENPSDNNRRVRPESRREVERPTAPQNRPERRNVFDRGQRNSQNPSQQRRQIQSNENRQQRQMQRQEQPRRQVDRPERKNVFDRGNGGQGQGRRSERRGG